MHIVVDALLVYGAFSGVQHAILHQLRALLNTPSPHRYSIITLSDVDITAFIGTTLLPYTVITAPVKSGQRMLRIIWSQTALPNILRQVGADLLYSPGYLTSLRWPGRAVVFVHDTIALSHPKLCKPSNVLNYRMLLAPSARHATRVAVPSQATARDVVQFCHVNPEHIDVVPLGVVMLPKPTIAQIDQAKQNLKINSPYLIALSTIEPKKNFANLIRWFNTWKVGGIPHQLVIIGQWGWKYADVRQAWHHSPQRQSIHFPGYIPQSELAPIIAGADALLMPSLYEGFGLPALEAMAVGTPVIASDQGALNEVVDNAGIILPLHGHLWRDQVPILLRDQALLHSCSQSGLIRAQQFSWPKTAQELLSVFSRAIQQ